MKDKEIIDTILKIESETETTLQTINALKEEVSNLMEKNQSLQIENEHLRERLDEETNPMDKDEDSGGLTKSRLNLENIYVSGFHVCNMFYGQRRVEDEPCAFCVEVIYGERK